MNNFINKFALLAADLLINILSRLPRPNIASCRNASRGKKIVFIFAPDLLGDAFSHMPFLSTVRENMPQQEFYIVILVLEKYRQAYEMLPFFDQILTVKSFLSRHPIINLLNGNLNWALFNRADFFISCLRAWSKSQNHLRMLLRAKKVFAPAMLDLSNKKNWLQTVNHQLLNKFSLVTPTGHNVYDRSEQLLHLIFGREVIQDRKIAEKIIIPQNTSIPCPTPNNYIVLVPGAGAEFRQWPLQKFQSCAQELLAKFPHYHIIIVGTKAERPLGDAIAAHQTERIYNLCGKTSIYQLAWLLKNSNLVIANETGTSNFSALLGTKTICILGGGDFGALFPSPEFHQNTICVFNKDKCFCCGWKCSKIDLNTTVAPCIDSISINDIVSTATDMLSK